MGEGQLKASHRLKPTIQRNARLIADQFGRFADENTMRSSKSGDEFLYVSPPQKSIERIQEKIVGNPKPDIQCDYRNRVHPNVD